MLIENVWIFTEERRFQKGFVRVTGNEIAEVGIGHEGERDFIPANRDETEVHLNGEDCYLVPGMIDVHLHGCRGYDFCDGTAEAVSAMAAYQASIGVTSFVPATMTLPVDKLRAILRCGAQYQQEKEAGKYLKGADLAGINMEGPFISKLKKGAQREADIIAADVEIYQSFQQAAGGLVKYIGIAPEVCEAEAFIRQVKNEVTVTLAHSNANYDTAVKAFEAGAGHVTHLFNGMSDFGHREPGIVGAAVDCKHVEAELICDGVHVHPAVIRAAFAMLGADRILFISDSMRAVGMPDGEYELGGQQVVVKGNRAVLKENGTIAGSVTTLPECLRYAVKEAGIALEEALVCVTENPARSLGIFEKVGSVAAGKQADLVLLDKELRVRTVVKDGVVL